MFDMKVNCSHMFVIEIISNSFTPEIVFNKY